MTREDARPANKDITSLLTSGERYSVNQGHEIMPYMMLTDIMLVRLMVQANYSFKESRDACKQ